VAAVLVALAGVAAAAPPTGRVVGKVTIADPDGKPVDAEAIIYVLGFTEPAPPNAAPTSISQKDRAFVPDLVAITVGETVSFPNRDPFLHNVFSQSAARKFDLGSFKKDEQKSKDFPDPGVIDVYCNIHPEMAATIIVVPNRAHTRRNHDGSFVIDRVPPGKWQVFAYARRTKPVSTWVTVTAGQDAHADLALARGAAETHLNKYGEKYHDTGTTTYH